MAPGVEPPTQRETRLSPARKRFELRGRLRLDAVPVEQSAVPFASWATVSMTHVLAAAPLCAAFGTGSGGPNRHPALVQVSHLQFPPGQSAFVRHDAWWFEPPEQRVVVVAEGPPVVVVVVNVVVGVGAVVVVTDVGVVEVVVVEMAPRLKLAVPLMLTAPGPGRSAPWSIEGFPVPGTQNVPASV